MDVNAKRYQNLAFAYQNVYFDVKNNYNLTNSKNLLKELKDNTAKYEETMMELRRTNLSRKKEASIIPVLSLLSQKLRIKQ